MAITAKIETITPEKASGYVTDGVFNRDVVESHVMYLANQMRSGSWKENGQSVVFDDRGRLLDGQHRMQAVILAKTPVKMMVVRGVDSKTFSTMDTGRPRFARDVLSIEGYENAEKFGAVLRYIYRWTNGIFPGDDRYRRASNNDLLLLAKKYPEAHESVRWAFKRDRAERVLTGRTTVAFAHWATTHANPTEARRFWSAFVSGDGGAKSASTLLRNRILIAFSGKKASSLRDYEVIAACAVAWKYHINDTKADEVKWSPSWGWQQFIGWETPVPCAKPARRARRRPTADAVVTQVV